MDRQGLTPFLHSAEATAFDNHPAVREGLAAKPLGHAPKPYHFRQAY